jgi:hypothetical protein
MEMNSIFNNFQSVRPAVVAIQPVVVPPQPVAQNFQASLPPQPLQNQPVSYITKHLVIAAGLVVGAAGGYLLSKKALGNNSQNTETAFKGVAKKIADVQSGIEGQLTKTLQLLKTVVEENVMLKRSKTLIGKSHKWAAVGAVIAAVGLWIYGKFNNTNEA